MKLRYLYILPLLILISCTNTSPDDLIDDEPIIELVTYSADIAPIIQSQCTNCHSTVSPSGNLILETFDNVQESTDSGSLIDRITRSPGDPLIMPQNSQLPSTSINLIIQWQTDGFLEN